MKYVQTIIVVLLVLFISCNETNSVDTSVNTEKISYAEITEYLRPAKQAFSWSAKSDTIITCSRGTKVFLPKDCLDPQSYNKKEPVQIEIKECLKLSEFIGERLTTITNDQVLETGGMLHIAVFQSGKQISVLEGKEYGVLFPKATNSKTPMRTFYGSLNDEKNIIWEVETPNKKTTQPERITRKSLTKCGIKLFSYTSGFDDDEDIEWVVSTSNESTPYYIEKNLNPTKKQVDKFCEKNGSARYEIWYDLTGNVKKIDVEESVLASFDTLFVQFVKSMPPIKVNELTKKYINRSYTISFNTYILQAYENEDYAIAFKEKYASVKDQILNKVDKAELNYYVLSASKFGWINCDRFWETDEEKIDFFVEIDNIKDVNLNLVFTEINSIMPAYKVGNKYLFKNVPIGRKVKLIGIGYEDALVAMAVSPAVISKTNFNLSGFKSFKLSELEKELNSI